MCFRLEKFANCQMSDVWTAAGKDKWRIGLTMKSVSLPGWHRPTQAIRSSRRKWQRMETSMQVTSIYPWNDSSKSPNFTGLEDSEWSLISHDFTLLVPWPWKKNQRILSLWINHGIELSQLPPNTLFKWLMFHRTMIVSAQVNEIRVFAWMCSRGLYRKCSKIKLLAPTPTQMAGLWRMNALGIAFSLTQIPGV